MAPILHRQGGMAMSATAVQNEQAQSTEVKQRWFGRAIALAEDINSDSVAAIGSAIRKATSDGDVKLVMIMAAEHIDFADITAGIHASELAEDVKVIGWSAGAQHSAEHGATTGGVIVAALGGVGFNVQTAHAPVEDEQLYEAAFEASAAATRELNGDHRMLLMFTDGLLGDSQEYVRGAYSAAGASWPLVGGASSDIGTFSDTWQFDGESLVRGVVAAAIVADSPIGIGMSHGWSEAGTQAMLVTKVEGMNILELNGRPALDVWAEHIGYSVEDFADDPELTAELIMTHPLALARDDRKEVRGLAGADIEQRALVGVTVTPEGEALWIMSGSPESVLESTEPGVEAAFDALQGADPIGLMAFGCMARRIVLTGPEYLDDEVAALERAAAGVPMVGVPVFGEIARTKGPRGFHNCTLITLAFS